MGKTNIEYTDEVSNPVMARPIGDESVKIGTFCEKPDAEGTCKTCWAEVLNLRFGNKLTFDKSNRDKIEWIKREKEMARLLMRNKQKPESKRNPGNPLMVFCCDTFDIFQPSISDELRNWVFDNYDQCENLTLQIQTTYPAKMSRYFRERYGDGDLPKQYWIGMSAGNQPFLERNIEYLLAVKAIVRYVIFEPLLGEIKFKIAKEWDQPHHEQFWMAETKSVTDDYAYWTIRGAGIKWVIVGGESGNNPRPCDIAWIRSIVQQCSSASVPVLVKQLGANPTQPIASSTGLDFSKVGISQPFPVKHSKGGDINEFPADLKIRDFPKL